MSTVIAKNVQVGTSTTATDNFTIFQPATPDGTLRIGNGNTGVTTGLVTLDSSGNLGLGTASPSGASGTTFAVNGGAGQSRLALKNTNSGDASSDGFQIALLADGINVVYQNRESGYQAWELAGSEQMRLTSTGLGIGTSSPSSGARLTVTSGASSIVRLFNNNQTTGSFELGQGFSSGSDNVAYVWNNSNASMVFGTNATERARITSDGNLLVGGISTQPWGAFKQAVYSTNLSSTVNGVAVVNAANSTGGYYIGFVNYLAGFAGFISQTGVSTVNYATTSDYRLKENIAPMTGALAKVIALKPVTYTWKSDGSNGQGFIAHELQEVVPDCVTGNKDEVDGDGKPKYQGIDTSFLVATLTAAIQELKAEFDAYKASHP
jgi:hypothetical protein